jgi:hypothetical protein
MLEGKQALTLCSPAHRPNPPAAVAKPLHQHLCHASRGPGRGDSRLDGGASCSEHGRQPIDARRSFGRCAGTALGVLPHGRSHVFLRAFTRRVIVAVRGAGRQTMHGS